MWPPGGGSGEARVWGGMHFRHAIVEGKAQGDKIGQKAIEVRGDGGGGEDRLPEIESRVAR